jgi:hypothetical protein
MTLVFDRRDELKGQPMAHAFLVGVSEYTHLPGDGEPANADKFNLKRLGSCALSAWEICRWLVANADALACKLGSIRLLMSPSAEELAAFKPIDGPPPPTQGWLGKSPKDVDAADWDHFVPEALEWRIDAARENRKGLAFFYYSGHGLKRFSQDLITLADFTDTAAGGKLQRSCELIANFVQGMSPTGDSRQNIARNQFYFIDCCREDIVDFAGLASSPGTVWDPLNGVDDRATPVFMASYPGAVAMAIRGKTTDFCQGLLNSLETGAEGPDPVDATKGWPVTSHTLSKALEHYFAKLGTGQYAPATGISFKNVPFRWLSDPPPVQFSLVVRPDAAIGITTVSLKHVKGFLDQEFPAAPAAHPYKVQSRAGIHKITATSTGTFQPYDDFQLINPFWLELPINLR